MAVTEVPCFRMLRVIRSSFYLFFNLLAKQFARIGGEISNAKMGGMW